VTTVAIFSFMGNWNDFMNPLIYLNQESKFTLALGLQRFLNEHGAEWDLLMAASVLITLPMIAVFFSAQQYFMQGIRMTGVKG
jgi:multiple sugar transport system permease protein